MKKLQKQKFKLGDKALYYGGEEVIVIGINKKLSTNLIIKRSKDEYGWEGTTDNIDPYYTYFYQLKPSEFYYYVDADALELISSKPIIQIY